MRRWRKLKENLMKKETAKTVAICLAMAFMFCMGSQMSKPIPPLVQSAIGTLMIIFSVLASRASKKAGEEK